MGDFSYSIKPGADGAWRMTANAFPSLVFDTPTDDGRAAGKIDLTGIDIDSYYDPAQPVPFASRAIFGDIVGYLRIINAGKSIPFRIEELGFFQVDMKQTTTDTGADLALHETLRTAVERMSVPIETQPNAKLDMTLKVGVTSVDGTIDQFRTQQALAVWRFILAHKDEPKNQMSAAAVKTILAAGLPGWEKTGFTADMSDLAFDMSLASAHMKGLREIIDLLGFTAVATGLFGSKDRRTQHAIAVSAARLRVAAAALAGLRRQFEGQRTRSDRRSRAGRAPAIHPPEGHFARRPGQDCCRFSKAAIRPSRSAPGVPAQPAYRSCLPGANGSSRRTTVSTGHILVSADSSGRRPDFVTPPPSCRPISRKRRSPLARPGVWRRRVPMAASSGTSK